MTEYKPLKITAFDEEDLDILLTLLQDSLIPVVSIVYDQSAKTVTFLINRFCWETSKENEEQYARVHAGLLFHNVEAIHEKNVHQENKKRILSFLIGKIEKTKDSTIVYLLFSDDACIRLTLSNIHGVFADIDEPWITHSFPQHLKTQKTSSHKNNI